MKEAWTLGELGGLIRAGWRMMLFWTAAGVVLGLIVIGVTPTTYRANAQLIIGSVNANRNNVIEPAASLVYRYRKASTIEELAKELRMDPAAVRRQIRVGNTRTTVEVFADAPSPELAKERAEHVADRIVKEHQVFLVGRDLMLEDLRASVTAATLAIKDRIETATENERRVGSHATSLALGPLYQAHAEVLSADVALANEQTVIPTMIVATPTNGIQPTGAGFLAALLGLVTGAVIGFMRLVHTGRS